MLSHHVATASKAQREAAKRPGAADSIERPCHWVRVDSEGGAVDWTGARAGTGLLRVRVTVDLLRPEPHDRRTVSRMVRP
jgi:hypothetical protein